MGRTCVLNGMQLTSKKELHALLSAELALPAWYGNNLDALYDCLTETTEDIQIELLHYEQLEAVLGGYAKALRRVLQDAAKENPRIYFKG